MNLKILILGVVILISVGVTIALIVIFVPKEHEDPVASQKTTTMSNIKMNSSSNGTSNANISPTTTISTSTTTTTAASTTLTIPKQSIPLTFPPGAYSKLMVATGTINDVQGSDTVEVIDLSDPQKTCTNVVQYPFIQYGSTGGLGPDGRPLVCGGVFNPSNCYGLANGAWSVYNTMKSSRQYPSSGTLPKAGNLTRMVVVGGMSSGFAKLNSSEILEDSGWQMKAALPTQVYFSCIAIMDANTWMVASGRIDAGGVRGNRTFIYDAIKDSWTPGPDLPTFIASGTCGTVNKDATGTTRSYIVIGGVTNSGWIGDTYILDQGAIAWRDGPKLPYGIGNQVAIDDPLGGVLNIGGRHGLYNPLKTIYRLAHGATQWVLLTQELKIGRWKFAAFLIPDGYATCA